MIRITLTSAQLLKAAGVGARRHIQAIAQGRRDAYGFDGEGGWQKHIDGACGELAAALALELHWDGPVGTFKRGGDIGDIQVRTRSKSHYELLVRPGDRDEDVFVHVTGTAPVYSVIGWMRGQEAKQACWMKDFGGRPDAYFVPTKALKPMEALKALVKEREIRCRNQV